MSTPERTWRGSTLDVRTHDRRAQLIAAALELLGTEGAAALTMRAVCRSAQLSPRYFYESFADRDALMLAAFDVTLERMHTAVTDAFNAATEPQEALRAGFTAATRLVDDDPRVGRILFREPFADDVLRAHAVAAIPQFFLGTLVKVPEGGELLRAVDTKTLDLQISAVSGALLALFLDRTEGRITGKRDRFVDYCTNVARVLLSA